jgi:hypothetical protein
MTRDATKCPIVHKTATHDPSLAKNDLVQSVTSAEVKELRLSLKDYL